MAAATQKSGDDGNMLDDLAQFDLCQEVAEANSKKPWSLGHYAKTLFKKKDFRVVLIVMEGGSKIREHHADGAVSVQVIRGKVRLTARGEDHDLSAGYLLTLGAGIKHDAEALEPSAFLLTISWPRGEDLLALKHRGYGT